VTSMAIVALDGGVGALSATDAWRRSGATPSMRGSLVVSPPALDVASAALSGVGRGERGALGRCGVRVTERPIEESNDQRSRNEHAQDQHESTVSLHLERSWREPRHQGWGVAPVLAAPPTEGLAQLIEPALQALAHGGLGRVGFDGDLGHREAVRVAQQNGALVRAAQLTHGAQYVLLQLEQGHRV